MLFSLFLFRKQAQLQSALQIAHGLRRTASPLRALMTGLLDGIDYTSDQAS